MRIQSRSKTTTRINEFETAYTFRGETKTVVLPREAHPHCVVMPQLIRPGIVAGTEPMHDFIHQGRFLLKNVPAAFFEAVGIPQSEIVEIESNPGVLRLHPFARAIAKIGYCQAITKYGLDGFDPLDVPDMICGRYPYPSYYVGGFEEPNPLPDPSAWHSVHVIEMDVRGRRLLVAAVRLFQNFGTPNVPGMPAYGVVVGELK